MILFYHGDMDGIVSANIFLENTKNEISKERKVRAFEFEYDKENAIFNIPITTVKKESIIFVDCCPSEEVLQYCASKTNELIVLDHHISKKELIDTYYQEGLLNGMSYIGASASLITWCWFHFNKDIEKIIMFLDRYKKSLDFQNNSDIPLALRLVNSWDIWDGMYIDAEPFKIYFETQNLNPIDKKIQNLLTNGIEVNKAIREGNTMMEFYHNWGNQYCEKFGYEVQYKNYNFYVLNVGNANSKIFGDRINDYDAVIIYCNDGVKYRCSIYSVKDNFNCAEFAETLNGGGHKGAAGFVLDELPIWLRDKKSGLIYKKN